MIEEVEAETPEQTPQETNKNGATQEANKNETTQETNKNESTQEIQKNEATQETKKNEDTETELVEFHGQKLTPRDKKHMQRVLDYLHERNVREKDISRFIKEFHECKRTGVIKIKVMKHRRCVCCHKRGHSHIICPKRWTEEEVIPGSCFMCGKPGFPHPECQEKRVCFACKEVGHISEQCPKWNGKNSKDSPQGDPPAQDGTLEKREPQGTTTTETASKTTTTTRTETETETTTETKTTTTTTTTPDVEKKNLKREAEEEGNKDDDSVVQKKQKSEEGNEGAS